MRKSIRFGIFGSGAVLWRVAAPKIFMGREREKEEKGGKEERREKRGEGKERRKKKGREEQEENMCYGCKTSP